METKYSRTIKSISYLNENSTRDSRKVNKRGKFNLGLSITVDPSSFVNMEQIREKDPVLTLVDGDKVRVFYGGSSDQMLVQASGIIENHINFFESEKKKKTKTKSNDEYISSSYIKWFDLFSRGSD